MPKVRFTGAVYPASINITSYGHPTVNWTNNGNKIADISSAIENNKLIFDCDVVAEDRRILADLSGRVHVIADGIISLLCFKTGYGLTYIIDKYSLNGGEEHDVQWVETDLAEIATAVARDENHVEVLSTIIQDLELLLAIRDLADTIRSHYTSVIGYTRAIETIRNKFIPPGGTKKDGWAQMRTALNLDEARLRQITALSRGPRHGVRMNTDQALGRAACITTWKIMNRYLELKRRKIQELPVGEFPLLDS